VGDAVLSCSSCGNALADGALFCPSCGAATPTEISRDTGVARSAATTQASDDEQRRRVQNALGESFQVLRLLGQGGFAEVWAASDLKLKRQVAVKVLRGDLVVSAALSERFRREAEAVAKLRHPNIVPIYQVGEGAGLSYYVMPLIEGESLRHRMEQGPLAIADARRILEEVAGALSVAHKAGIIHRDIKPDNIMLEGEEARAVVMDFGIAKALSEGEAGLTGTGMIVGTPHYMSPEQASGEKTVDSRSDIYSLGIVAYQMVAGELPFAGDSAQEVLVKQISAKPKPLDAVRPDTPVELSEAVMKCLRKAPAERWNTAGELAAAVRPAAPALVRRLPRVLRRPAAILRWRPSTRQVIWGAAAAAVVATILWLGLSATDVEQSVRYWAVKAGVMRPRPEAALVAPVPRLSRIPQGSALAGRRVFSMGGSRLAVIDGANSVLGIPAGFGQTWRSFPKPAGIGSAGATQAGNDVLLFPYLGGHSYRWSTAGVVMEDTVPFGIQASWADPQTAVAIGYGEWQLAQRDARGWHRVPSPRRVRLTAIGGTAVNDLVALGDFAPGFENLPDSIVEFDGTSWESVDPRPAGSSETWRFSRVVALEERSFAVGGGVGEWTNVTRWSGTDVSGEWKSEAPLLLIRASPGRWRRIPLRPDSGSGLSSIGGIWGSGPDDLILWDPACDDCRLVELHKGSWSANRTMGPGRVVGVADVGGVPYVVWGDGTVWARRNGRWVYSTEVPNTIVTTAVGAAGPSWTSRLEVGVGRDNLFLCNPGCNPNTSRLGDTALDASRGAAVGRGIAWVLGRGGVLSRITCAAGALCTVGREPISGGLFMAQRKQGGALLVGTNGLAARSSEAGVWKRLQLPAVVTRESLISADEGADGHLALLGSQHLAHLDSLGRELHVAPLVGKTRPAHVLAAPGGATALVYPDEVVIERADGTRIWSQFGQVATGLSLSDGRLVMGLAGDASDPFETGSVLVIAVDSAGVRSRTLPIGRVRSRVTALAEQTPDLIIYTTAGSYHWPLAGLPFAKPPAQATEPRRSH